MTNEEMRVKVLKQIEEKLRVGDHTISIDGLDFTEFDRHVSISELKSPKNIHANYWKTGWFGIANFWEVAQDGFTKGWQVKGKMYPTMKENNQVEKIDNYGNVYYENIKTYTFENMTKEQILKELEEM